MTSRPYIPKCIPILAISVAMLAAILYHTLNYSCNLDNESEEMSCGVLFFIAYSPWKNSIKINLVSLASEWGLTDFNSSMKNLFDAGLYNTTESFISPNITQLPVLIESLIINGTRTYIYTPIGLTKEEISPALIYLHGGGGATGSPEYYDATARYLSHHLQQKLIVPEYIRVPLQIFPGIEEECLKVARYFLERGEELRVDSNRLSIGGDSFGGHLVIYIVTKWNLINPDKKFKSVVLIYPSIQWLSLELDSFKDQNNQYRILTSRMIANYISLGISGTINLVPYILNSTLPLMSKHYSSRRDKYPHLFPEVDWNASPNIIEKYSKYADIVLSPYTCFLFQENLAFFPPTLMISAEYDTLYTEGYLFKEKLESFNVEVYYKVYKKMFHGFAFLYPPRVMFNDTLRSLDDIVGFVKKYVVS